MCFSRAMQGSRNSKGVAGQQQAIQAGRAWSSGELRCMRRETKSSMGQGRGALGRFERAERRMIAGAHCWCSLGCTCTS